VPFQPIRLVWPEQNAKNGQGSRDPLQHDGDRIYSVQRKTDQIAHERVRDGISAKNAKLGLSPLVPVAWPLDAAAVRCVVEGALPKVVLLINRVLSLKILPIRPG
jgi:hypothetical protein